MAITQIDRTNICVLLIDVQPSFLKNAFAELQDGYGTLLVLLEHLLMLDKERVIISKGENCLIKAFKDWGFKSLVCNFYDFESVAGDLHCASVDISRNGQLQSYF